MTYGDIYRLFCVAFPDAKVSDYRPQDNKPNAIHIWLKFGGELVFTYNSPDSWSVETYEHYTVNDYKKGYDSGVDDFIHTYLDWYEERYNRFADDERIEMLRIGERLKGGVHGKTKYKSCM